VTPRRLTLLLLAAAATALTVRPALAQSDAHAPVPEQGAGGVPVYKPPLRGAPGGRVGGASRSAVLHRTPLPLVELLAPSDQAGVTAQPAPVLYFFISRPSRWPMQFTISAPGQPTPVIEATIPSATAAGIYPVPTAQYHLRLQPGITYTWSVSVVLDPRAWSHNVVASASLEFDPTLAPPAVSGGPLQRAAQLAQAGLWYDAVAAAAEAAGLDRHRALDALLQQVGLKEAAAFERGVPTE
jgi:hypothetical protein